MVLNNGCISLYRTMKGRVKFMDITYTRIANSVIIFGPSRVIEKLDGTQIDILQYTEFLMDATKLDSRIQELLATPEILNPPIPEGWKEYKWVEKYLPRLSGRDIKYFS